MKVRELIGVLQGLNGDLDVFVEYDGMYYVLDKISPRVEVHWRGSLGEEDAFMRKPHDYSDEREVLVINSKG